MRTVINLDTGWSLSDKGEKTALTLPYVLTDGKKGFETVLTKELSEEVFTGGQNVFLEFSGVTGKCDVYFDGVYITSHNGLFNAFCADVTELATASGVHKLEAHVASEGACDSFIFGRVKLISVPKSHFTITANAEPALGVSAVSVKNEAMLHITAAVTNPINYDVISYTVTDSDSVIAGSKTAKPTQPDCDIMITEPKKWNGQHASQLYTLTAVMLRDNNILDEVSVSFGIREISLEKDGFFHLNSMKLPLNGIRLTNNRNIAADIKLFDMLDANTVCASSLACETDILRWCDKNGVIFWYDFPCTGTEDDFSALNDFVVQNRLHPSLAFIGYSDGGDAEYARKFVETVKNACPYIYTALMCPAMKNEDVNDVIPDAFAFSVPGSTDEKGFIELENWFAELKASHREYHFAVFADAPECIYTRNTATLGKNDCSQEYFCFWHEKLWSIFCREKGVFGYFAGLLTDEAEKLRRTGLATYDRKGIKDAFWFYKSQFSAEPFIKLCSGGLDMVTEKYIDVKCYATNTPDAITVNGKSKKKYKATELSDGVYVFNRIKLKRKNNIIEITAAQNSDKTEIFRSKSNLKKK